MLRWLAMMLLIDIVVLTAMSIVAPDEVHDDDGLCKSDEPFFEQLLFLYKLVLCLGGVYLAYLTRRYSDVGLRAEGAHPTRPC